MRRMYSVRRKYFDSNRDIYTSEIISKGEEQDVSNTTREDNNVIEIRKYRIQRTSSEKAKKELLALISLLREEDEKPGN